jgi:hypothetical protein
MARIYIEFTLFSAFYSPLISVMSGGFLREEGLEALTRGKDNRRSSARESHCLRSALFD